MTVTAILALIALLLAIIALFRPEWPLLNVAVILVCVGLLVPVRVRQ